MRSPNGRPRWLLPGILAIIVVLVLAWRCRPIPTLTEGALSGMRETFNAGNDGPRVLVFLVSGCATCEMDATALESVLGRLPGPLVVIAVWEPLKPTDGPPTSQMLSHLRDRRVTQVWDPDHRLSDEMAKAEVAYPGSIPQDRLRTGERSDGILYHAVALFPPGAPWGSTLPAPSYLDGGLEPTLGEVERRLQAYMLPAAR